MKNILSRRTLIRQISKLKKEITSLEKQIIQTEIILHQYNKRIKYHDRFKENGFRKRAKENIRKEVDNLDQSKFQLIERLLEKRQSLESIRQRDANLV